MPKDEEIFLAYNIPDAQAYARARMTPPPDMFASQPDDFFLTYANPEMYADMYSVHVVDPEVYEVAVVQPFVDRFDPDVLVHQVKPVKTVVVSQTPAAGDDVPAGTSVSVTTTVKDYIPIDVFAIDDVLTAQYTNVGDLLTAVAANTAVETVMTRNVAFEALSAPEKKNVEDFVKPLFNGPASAADIARVYEDVKFVYKM